MKYRIGDRVVWKKSMGGKFYPGLQGTVVSFSICGHLVKVAWDKNVNGHTAGGNCCRGYGWNLYPYMLEKLEPEVDKEYEELLV